MTGIEPALSAWEADVLPLNYTRALHELGSAVERTYLIKFLARRRTTAVPRRNGDVCATLAPVAPNHVEAGQDGIAPLRLIDPVPGWSRRRQGGARVAEMALRLVRALSVQHAWVSAAVSTAGIAGVSARPRAGYGGRVLLSDRDIRGAIDAKRVILDPFEPSMVQPSSIDVRIDRYFRLFDNHKYPVIDPSQEQPELTRLVEVATEEAFILHPGEFVLASTFEVVTLADDVAARLEGKSSLGRLGLLTHSTAGFIDPGFSGHVTLELSNVATLPIKLWPGMKIGQLCFFELSSPAEFPYGAAGYGSRYQGQRGPTASRSFQSFYRTTV